MNAGELGAEGTQLQQRRPERGLRPAFASYSGPGAPTPLVSPRKEQSPHEAWAHPSGWAGNTSVGASVLVLTYPGRGGPVPAPTWQTGRHL